MIDKLIEAAKKIKATEMLSIANNALSILMKEGNLFYLPPKGSSIVIGDLHGDLESLHSILKKSKFDGNKDYLIFLGDYGDRGLYSAEVYYVVLKLKQKFPEKVILLRGNHEFLPGLEVWPHNLPIQLTNRFGKDGGKIYSSLKKLWEHFCSAAIIEGKYLFLHGGLPIGLKSLEKLKNPDRNTLEQILWNDPVETKGSYSSPRGAGKLFGKDTTTRILSKIKIKTLIRSHQPPQEGFKVSHRKRILTISSNHVYGGKAAYLKLNFDGKPKNAHELSKHIVKF